MLRNPYETKNRAHKILTEVGVGGVVGGGLKPLNMDGGYKTGGGGSAHRPI